MTSSGKYYVNDRPHIGHLYTTTIADVVARYQRMRGLDVFFLTGTDEHAAKVVDTAAEKGFTTQDWADRNAKEFQDTFARLGIENDDFIRTSEERHKERVRHYVRQLLDSDDVYVGEFEGWYDAGQEEYIPENKAVKTDYTSAITGKPLVKKAEKNYFFRLSNYQDAILAHLEAHPGATRPKARRNEVIARVKDGLNDVPISRGGAGDWGIRFPADDTHTIYVWIDALFNYLSTIDTDERRHYWPADLHCTAKEILWFHSVIWPALLMALQKLPGNEWMALPREHYAHSFWICEGQKMSKSLHNFVDLEMIDDYVERFSLDGLRWFLATRGPLGVSDSDFAENRFIEVYNSELANTFGNSLNRVLNMTARYLDGTVADPGGATSECQDVAIQAVAKHAEAMEKLALEEAGQAAMGIVAAVDRHIDATKPFKLAKDPEQKDAVGAILYHCAESLRIASLLLWPIMPEKCGAALTLLGQGDAVAALANRGRGDLASWTRFGGLAPGTVLPPAEPLFPRYQA